MLRHNGSLHSLCWSCHVHATVSSMSLLYPSNFGDAVLGEATRPPCRLISKEAMVYGGEVPKLIDSLCRSVKVATRHDFNSVLVQSYEDPMVKGEWGKRPLGGWTPRPGSVIATVHLGAPRTTAYKVDTAMGRAPWWGVAPYGGSLDGLPPR